MRVTLRSLVVQATAVAVAAGTVSGLTGGTPAWADSPSTYSVRGIDVSHHNNHPIEWHRVAASGETFVFHKATQGTSFRDGNFAADFRDAAAAGLLNAPYHFWDKGSGTAQADHFVRTVRAAGYDGRRPGQLPPALDLEKIKGRCPTGVSTNQVTAFLNRLRATFGVEPIVYTSRDFVDSCLKGDASAFSRSPLWQPRYSGGKREPAPIGGRYWSFWQYTEKGSVPGIRGNVDRNVYKGTLDQLRKLAHLAPGQRPGAPAQPGQPGEAQGGQEAQGPQGNASGQRKIAAWPLLRSGQRGADVTAAQYLLTAHGHRTTVDGVYGSGTAAAVAAFQRQQGLTADGVIGPQTWQRLVVTVKPGSQGDAVRAAQTQLSGYGHKVAVDGVFGPATERATRAFQQAHGLPANGVVGPETWQALIGGKKTHTPSQPGTPGGGSGKKLTHAQAAQRLRAAGIRWVSTGNCSNKKNRRCTSFDGVREHTINGLVALKKNSGCPVVVTGGTETGHAKGTKSHENGYKIDIRPDSCVSKWILAHSKFSYDRGDAKVYRGTLAGRTVDYARERNHWDITFH